MPGADKSNGCVTLSYTDLKQLCDTTALVKSNLQSLQKQWDDLKDSVATTMPHSQILNSGEVVVNKQSLQALSREADRMKTSLPKLFNQKLVSAKTTLTTLENDLEKAKAEKVGLETEVLHWKTQAETVVADAQREKRSLLELRVDVQELTSQLSQQSEFCSSLGAACCTLLWRLSRRDDSVHDIISGTKSAEFLDLVATSVQSYLSAYKDDQWPDQQTDEAIFVIALCGTATNIAASAVGREHLATIPQGRQVIDTFITFVGEAPVAKSANMKGLMLMTLFNVSINQKGVRYLSSKPGLISLLAWHLREESNPECRANTLRLLLSLASDDESNLRLVREMNENLSMSLLQQLTTESQADVKDLALDLLMDMRRFDAEP